MAASFRLVYLRMVLRMTVYWDIYVHLNSFCVKDLLQEVPTHASGAITRPIKYSFSLVLFGLMMASYP